MSDNIKIASLVILLIIIGFTFGYVYSVSSTDEIITRNQTSSSSEIISINGEREISSNTLVVTDKFVGELKEGMSTVVVGKDGSLISVQDGVVLTRGVVIEAKSGVTQEIHRIDSPALSLSLN